MINHISVVATKPMMVLIGSSYPLILKFQPSLIGRSSSGFLTLRLIIEAWANMKAKSEPKAYSAPILAKTLAAKKPGVRMISATKLNRIIET